MLGNTFIATSFSQVWSELFAFAVDLLGAAREQGALLGEQRDEDLARRMNQGDDRAFEILYERYFQKIYAFTVRRVSHHQVAEDLVAEIFLKAFRHRLSFTWKTSFSAWIYRIATNTITDHYRTRKSTNELDEQTADVASSQHLATEVDVQLLGRELEAVIVKLGERERIAVTMKFYGACSNDEIGQALKVSANNAAVILHRALKKCEQHAGERLKSMI